GRRRRQAAPCARWCAVQQHANRWRSCALTREKGDAALIKCRLTGRRTSGEEEFRKPHASKAGLRTSAQIVTIRHEKGPEQHLEAHFSAPWKPNSITYVSTLSDVS